MRPSIRSASRNGDDPGHDGVVLARALTRTAIRSVHTAVVRDEALLREVKENGKWTPEFEALCGTKVPGVVRRWIEANLWDEDGVVFRSVEAQLRIALARARPAPGDPAAAPRFDTVPMKLTKTPMGARRGRDVHTDHHAAGHNCDPWCGTP